MKFKSFILSIGFCGGLLIGSSSAQASTPITGTAYGEQTGLIHLDYTTAERPEGYSGPERDFFISPFADGFTGPGLSAFTAQIHDLGDPGGCDAESCLLTGFFWSDTIGWIVLDGAVIQRELPSFLSANFARVHTDNGALSGYAWSENAGWISFSEELSGSVAPVQTAEDWGVYLDLDSALLSDAEGNALGRPFRGYAWSENLGWIKFGTTAGDSPAFGVYTFWVPDSTPPEFYLENNIWFANRHETGLLEFPVIARDPESGIRGDSVFTISRDSNPDFANCNEPVAITQDSTPEGLILLAPSVGLIQNTVRGYCQYSLSGSINNNAGLTFQIGGTPPEGAGTDNYSASISFFVRAGSYDETKSEVVIPLRDSAVADGTAALDFRLNLFDIARNPILPIECEGCPSRRVEANALITNEMRYDSINLSDTFPVKVNSEYLSPHGAIQREGLLPVAETYPLSFTSFAPSTPLNTLEASSFEITLEDALLPRLTRLLPPTEAQTNPTPYIEAIPATAQSLRFEPGLVTLSGRVKTGEELNQVIDGTPALLEFQMQNLSALSLGHFSIDTLFEFYSETEGLGDELLETHDIQSDLSDSESVMAWLDPLAPIRGAHYEIYSGDSLDGSNSPFHASYPLRSDVSPDVSAALDSEGVYPISELYEIPSNLIDRSDLVSMTLGAAALSAVHPVRFTPAFFLPPQFSVNDVNLRIAQDIAYRYPDQEVFTVYRPANLIEGINVQSTGAQFKGLGSGEAIFNGNVEVVGARALRRAGEQIRRNAATLTLNLPHCTTAISLTEDDGDGHLNLKTSGSCVKKDDNSNTIVAYYQGSASDILPLGDGIEGKNIYIPEGYKYTLVLKGGMNLFIRNNVAYRPSDPQSSFGMILMSSEENQGAHVYLHPNPTNLVGLLYAEGSLLSSPDPLARRFFYGGTENPSSLNNQLYWQGNIASRNTLGGSKNNVVPEGVDCESLSPFECSQRYDMNFLRRFSASENSIANNGRFSGGGSCTEGVCERGPSLPTTVSLTTPERTIDRSVSRSLDAFYIEPIHRPTPPGFSATQEQESSEVIR